MTRTRVKICGLTRQEDVEAACSAGVDAIGLVFYPPSPRAVTIEQAKQILATVPPFISVTALFVNPDPRLVYQVLAELPISLLQFHGDESPEFCTQFQRPFIKAIPMKPDVNLYDQALLWSSALGLLVDTYKVGVAGGTGEIFDWQKLPQDLSKPLILAGGLSVDNVAEAIAQVHPFAVDVSGGVEVQKGIKDHQKMIAFIKQVQMTS